MNNGDKSNIVKRHPWLILERENKTRNDRMKYDSYDLVRLRSVNSNYPELTTKLEKGRSFSVIELLMVHNAPWSIQGNHWLFSHKLQCRIGGFDETGSKRLIQLLQIQTRLIPLLYSFLYVVLFYKLWNETHFSQIKFEANEIWTRWVFMLSAAISGKQYYYSEIV